MGDNEKKTSRTALAVRRIGLLRAVVWTLLGLAVAGVVVWTLFCKARSYLAGFNGIVRQVQGPIPRVSLAASSTSALMALRARKSRAAAVLGV
jgi:cytochrome c oxidase assembly protein Cox11